MSDKASVNREALMGASTLVRPALATQAYLPALTHILFADGWATSYNDISSISVRAPLELERCLPGELLIRTLGSFSGEQVAFKEGKDGAVVLSSGRSTIKLPTLAVKDFPFARPGGDPWEIGLDATILKGVSRCLLSVGNDPTHPAQMGVTLDVDANNYAVLFSTDNFSISRFQTKTKIKLPGDAPVIMPTFFCEQLLALFKAFPEDEMTLLLHDGALEVEYGKVARLFTKTLVDLEPLDFPTIINKHCKVAGIKEDLTAIPDAFDAALSRALLVLGGEVDKVTKVTASDGMLKLNSSSPMGDADDSMKCDAEAEDGNAFYVDPSLLARAAKVCGLVGFLPRVVVLADADAQFVHLVAHCSK